MPRMPRSPALAQFTIDGRESEQLVQVVMIGSSSMHQMNQESAER